MSTVSIGTDTKTLFGEGVRHELIRLPSLVVGEAHVLVVASSSALRRPLLDTLVNELRTVAEVTTWEFVRCNPRRSDIDACREQCRGLGITHVVGIGGGSAMDQAKATAMALHCDTAMSSLLASRSPLPKRSNKLVLLPTTSGTGAELSYGAILTDETSNSKLGLRGVNLAADYALVDPELTWTTSLYLSMVTGFDILTHALETWISTAATPYTRDLSRGAIERVFRWLPVLHANLENKQARYELSYASMIMGINLALSTTCLPHRLQYPIGANTDTAHAEGLAAIYPAWLDHVLPHAESRLAECAEWISSIWEIRQCSGTREKAEAFVDAVKTLLQRIELTPSMRDLGITKEKLTSLALEVNGRLETDPSYTGVDDLYAIYKSAYSVKTDPAE